MGSWGMKAVPVMWWMRWPKLAVKEDSKVVGLKVKQKLVRNVEPTCPICHCAVEDCVFAAMIQNWRPRRGMNSPKGRGGPTPDPRGHLRQWGSGGGNVIIRIIRIWSNTHTSKFMESVSSVESMTVGCLSKLDYRKPLSSIQGHVWGISSNQAAVRG